MEIPKHLVDQIRSGSAVLFLGAGASMGAFHPQGKKPPNGQQLAKLLADKYLGPGFEDRPLAQVAELAINESNLFDVQEFIAHHFQDFSPAAFHKLIPGFIWPALVSTNFDLVIERAYSETATSRQRLVPFLKDTDKIEEKLRSPNNLNFIKLHGSINDTRDENVPLILTPDQYVTHRKGRKFLFERVQVLAANYPFIFIGSSLSDLDLRQILLDLEGVGEAKPRSFIVAPQSTPVDYRFWESKKITHLGGSFEDFLKEINAAIPENTRGLISLMPESAEPIRKHFQAGIPEPSESLKTFLSRDVEHVHVGIIPKRIQASDFYKGYFIDWSPVINHYDVRRSIVDDVIGDIVLAEETEKADKVEFVLIKGFAGSGKSVVLRRIAWESATTFGKLCLWLNRTSFPEYDPLVELHRLTNERIFLFIDKVSRFSQFIEEVIQKSKRDKLPITIIGSERFNEWNDKCENLTPLVSLTFELKNLSESEIEELISLLAQNKSLGHLATLSHAAQLEALKTKAGRQLLVALYEATSGKLFSDIIADEYNSIISAEAKTLYRTVCVLHRLGIPVRAGLISRVHGISFQQFEEKLFQPLEYIVYGTYNPVTRDNEYRSRHPLIAEMVFDQILKKAQDRFDEYFRLLTSLDLGYRSDQQAFTDLTNSKNLIKIFPDQAMIRQLYSAARARAGDDPFLMQQEGIFEMNSKGGSLVRASDLLNEAKEKAPHSRAILHSLAVLSAKKSEIAVNDAEKTKERSRSREIAHELIKSDPYSSHPYHTLLRIDVDELRELIDAGVESVIEQKVKEIERLISAAKQLFPDDEYLAAAEANYCKVIQDNSRAFEALKRAFGKNKKNQYLAMSLSKLYSLVDSDEAIRVLKECLDANPIEQKFLHFSTALLLSKKEFDEVKDDLGYHLKRSFTLGDENRLAHFLYARYLYIIGEEARATEIFNILKNARVSNEIRNKARDPITLSGIPRKFSGSVNRIEAMYCLVERDGFRDRLFAYRGDTEPEIWKKLGYSMRVTFNIGFNYSGPRVTSIRLE